MVKGFIVAKWIGEKPFCRGYFPHKFHLYHHHFCRIMPLFVVVLCVVLLCCFCFVFALFWWHIKAIVMYDVMADDICSVEIGDLDDNRWVKRILHWNPGGGRPGRPFFQWQTPLQNFCRWHHLGNWIDTAGSTDLWFQYYTDFISFCQWWCYIFTFSCLVCTYNAFAFHFLCPKWAAARHTGSKSKSQKKLATDVARTTTSASVNPKKQVYPDGLTAHNFLRISCQPHSVTNVTRLRMTGLWSTRESEDQIWSLGRRESFIWIIPRNGYDVMAE